MDRTWEYIDRSQTHEYMEIGTEGRAIPYLGIRKSKLLCSVSWLKRVFTLPRCGAELIQMDDLTRPPAMVRLSGRSKLSGCAKLA